MFYLPVLSSTSPPDTGPLYGRRRRFTGSTLYSWLQDPLIFGRVSVTASTLEGVRTRSRVCSEDGVVSEATRGPGSLRGVGHPPGVEGMSGRRVRGDCVREGGRSPSTDNHCFPSTSPTNDRSFLLGYERNHCCDRAHRGSRLTCPCNLLSAVETASLDAPRRSEVLKYGGRAVRTASVRRQESVHRFDYDSGPLHGSLRCVDPPGPEVATSSCVPTPHPRTGGRGDRRG